MGECSDWSVGELVGVYLTAGDIAVSVAAPVVHVWDDMIDVRLGDGVFRFDRRAFDCSGLEQGKPARVNGDSFSEFIEHEFYDPGEEGVA